jgi:hypothetical protein
MIHATPTFDDYCTIQNRTSDSDGMVDNETFTPQATPVRCRVMKAASRRKTTPDSTEKVQYGVFIFATILLPRNVTIAAHDRIVHEGNTYDVAEVNRPKFRKQVTHQIAICDVRA